MYFNGKDKYANRLEDSRNNDPGKSGYYKKEFDWETRRAYGNVYMDIYNSARNFIKIAKAKLKLANFDRVYANYQKNNSEINELTQQNDKLFDEYINFNNNKNNIGKKMNKIGAKIDNKRQKKFW